MTDIDMSRLRPSNVTRFRSVPRDVNRYIVDYRMLVGGRWHTGSYERDADRQDLETTISDMLGGQYLLEHVDRVILFNPVEGICHDVSEDVAIEIANRLNECEPARQDLLDFIEQHAGLAYARGLRAVQRTMSGEG